MAIDSAPITRTGIEDGLDTARTRGYQDGYHAWPSKRVACPYFAVSAADDWLAGFDEGYNVAQADALKREEAKMSQDAPDGGKTPVKKKFCYLGAPSVFQLEMAAKTIRAAYGRGVKEDEQVGLYLVGSCLETSNFRDVDVRLIVSDTYFDRLFPGTGSRSAAWQFDPLWLLVAVSTSLWLQQQIGVPKVDFQIQPATHANTAHHGVRHPIGLTFVRG